MNGTTGYQIKVNNLPGALGPENSAFWENTTKYTGSPFSLASQPMMYDPAKGVYITATDAPAASGSVNFSNFGFGRKYSRRGKKRGTKRSRKGKKRSRRGKKRGTKRSRRTKRRSTKKRSRRGTKKRGSKRRR